MHLHHPAAPCPPARAQRPVVAAALAILLAACGSTTPSQMVSPSGQASPSGGPVSQTPQPTSSPLPTPLPTPSYTNPADPELSAIIPTRVQGIEIAVPRRDQFAYTPGDFGSVYGELGLRFRSLQVAYVVEPRLSLYAARVDPPSPTTRSLEPYLATAAQYVGIAGLHREPWRFRRIGDRVTWVRPEDNATLAGTFVYTWAAGEFVFLMIGNDDTFNRAVFAALPGESRDRATPAPSPSIAASAEPSPTP
jgi:hypothetical protein